MVDFGTAFKKPFTDVKKLLIGCLLNIIPIINLFSTGYLLKVANNTMAKKKDMPEWTDWGDLFSKGILVSLIGLLYAIPVIIVAFVVFGVHFMSIMMTGELGTLGFGVFLLFFLFLLTTLVVPSAVLSFAADGKFGSAFQLAAVMRKAFTKEFLVAWLLSLLYMLLFGFLLGFIPFVGSGISGFIVGVTSFTMFAENYKKL